MTEQNDLNQSIELIEERDLLSVVSDVKANGFRLGQICATYAGETIELLYTFEKDNLLKNYKATVPSKTPETQSVTAIYPYAFIYENEMHDLFGVTFKNLGLDYGGKFFKTAKATPWNPAIGEGDKA